jgi:hypothetical protein
VSASHNQLSELFIIKPFLYLWRTRGILDDESQISIHLLSNDCDFKLHQIHGEGARLISKNILNLSQLLIQRCSLHIRPLLAQRTEHQFVVVDEVRLRHLDNLYRDD